MISPSTREWFVLDRLNQSQGPYTISEIQVLLSSKDFFVCKTGMNDWALARSIPEIRDHEFGGKIYNLHLPDQKTQSFESAMDQLLQLCKLLVADGYLSEEEIRTLDAWLNMHNEVTWEWPGSVIARRVQGLLEDGAITESERTDLQQILERAVGARPSVQQALQFATRLPVNLPAPEISFDSKIFCFTGEFIFGPRNKCEAAVEERGGVCVEKPTTGTHFLVIGTIANPKWAHQLYGRKIESAVALQNLGHKLRIVAEEHWVTFLDKFPADKTKRAVRSQKIPTPRIGPLGGNVFVLTGTLPNLKREDAAAKIEAAGGKVTATVSEKTNFIVAGSDAGPKKLDKANALGIKVIDEAELLRMLG